MYTPFNDEEETLTALSTVTLPARVRADLARAVATSGSFRAVMHGSAKSSRRKASDLRDQCREMAIEIVPLTSPSYPALLRRIDAPPLVLFVRGTRWQGISELAFAVVGARAASVRTCLRISTLSCELASSGVTVVSGLALGVDGAAHRGAIRVERELATVAVLAHGLDTIYPSSHEALASALVERHGLLVSEYPPGTPPFKQHFLERNRIIAGLSRGVLVADAGARSGSLVTAHCAADYGRDVFVLDTEEGESPGDGAKRLIEDGASPVRTSSEILTEYGIFTDAGGCKGIWLTVDETELLNTTSLGRADLLELEISGDLVRLGAGQIMLRRPT